MLASGRHPWRPAHIHMIVRAKWVFVENDLVLAARAG
jgi:protocatechuate 3,4-dioxygenase beta subunit